MRSEFEAAKAKEGMAFAQIAEAREKMKETRPAVREKSFKPLEQARDAYKQSVEVTMTERNSYKESIETRKAKEGALLDLVA